MHYLVDAYNLLFRAQKKRVSLEKSRKLMIEEFNERVSQLNLQVTLVFDGAEKAEPLPSRSHYDSIELVYTPKSITADEYILSEVMRSKTPSQMTVVTNDRELSIRCHNHRSKTMKTEEFIAFLSKKIAKKKKIPSKTRKFFRGSSSELARLLIIFEKKISEKSDKDSEEF